MIFRPTILAAIALIPLTGCQGGEEDNTRDRRSRRAPDDLGRPSLPRIVVRYDALMRDLQDALSMQVGGTGWSSRPPSTPTALCQEFGTEANTGLRTLPFIVFERFVPQPGWERAVVTITAVGRRYGFIDVARVIDRPDEHRLALTDRYGAELTVQDGPRLLSIGLITGCHQREENK